MLREVQSGIPEPLQRFSNFREYQLKAGETIFVEKTPNTGKPSVYVVTNGLIGLAKSAILPSGQERSKIVSVKKERDIFGFEDLDFSSHSVTAKALVPSAVTQVVCDIEDPLWQSYLLRESIAQVRESVEYTRNMPRNKTPSIRRVSSALIDLSQEDEVHVSHTIIGDRSGDVRERVERALNELTKRRIIEQSAPKLITIVDSDRLQGIAKNNPR